MSASSCERSLCYLQYLREEDAGSRQTRAGLRIRRSAGFIWLQVELEDIIFDMSQSGRSPLTDFNLFSLLAKSVSAQQQ